MRPHMYPRTSHWRNPRTVSSEIDLRAEFDDLVFGTNGIAHGSLFALRNMRRTESNRPVECVCFRTNTTIEPDPDCSYCLGEGYLWDESWITGYSMFINTDTGLGRKYLQMAPGMERTDYKVFFLRYDTVIEYQDKIVEMKLDAEGNPVIPYIRTAIYKPGTIYQYRSDHGRREYYALFCKEEDAWRQDH